MAKIRYYFEVDEEIKHCLVCPIRTIGNCELQTDGDGNVLDFSDFKKQMENCPLKKERVWAND